MVSLYCHIPFCERKCLYCDFYSIESSASLEPFVEALIREMAMAAASGEPADRTAGTVFFGGGTPSLLPPAELERILEAASGHWALAPGAEITLETNPGTVDLEKLRAYRALGVNRLSIGIQSFNPGELAFLSRIHDAAQAVRCVEMARTAGFENVSIDLIYSLPGQTAEGWLATLERGLALGPDHVSAYSLIVEEHTPLERMVRSGAVAPNPPEAEAALYERTMEVMARRGYEHYEVSNYARPGFACRHNLVYWHHGDYLGFGPSAHSFLRRVGGAAGTRWANIASISEYLRGIRRSSPVLAFREDVGERDMIRERVFLGLRGDGLPLEVLEAAGRLGAPAGGSPVVRGMLKEGLGVVDGGRLRLTDRGYLLCDEIAARLIP